MTMETYNCEYFDCDISLLLGEPLGAAVECDELSPNGTSYDNAVEVAKSNGWVFIQIDHGSDKDRDNFSICPEHADLPVVKDLQKSMRVTWSSLTVNYVGEKFGKED